MIVELLDGPLAEEARAVGFALRYAMSGTEGQIIPMPSSGRELTVPTESWRPKADGQLS